MLVAAPSAVFIVVSVESKRVAAATRARVGGLLVHRRRANSALLAPAGATGRELERAAPCLRGRRVRGRQYAVLARGQMRVRAGA